MRLVSGAQLDGRYVELFVEMLADKTLAYRHGEDADFDAELAVEQRVDAYSRPLTEEPDPAEVESGETSATPVPS